MRVFVQVILISFLFITQTTEGQENKKTTLLLFKEFTVVEYKVNQACLEQSGGTQYHDLLTNRCKSCESLENSHERYTLCPEYQLKKANTELEKKLELMELETRKQVAVSNTLAIVAIVLAIVLPTVIIAFVVRYNSRTLRSQDAKQNDIEESVKFLKTNGDPSTDETSASIANEESSTEPYHIPKILDTCKLNDDEIRELFQTIQHSSSKIEEMWIWMNPQLQHVSDVVATFPHFTRKLKLVLDGGDDERPEFCGKLTEEIINFDTSKLQTQELKVEVRYDGYSSTILEVVLRCGKPPQFTKFAIYEWNDDIRKLFQIIQHSSTKIEEMDITMNPHLEYVSDVVATFPLLTRMLKLELYGGDVERQRFCTKLAEEIMNFDPSKLQTQGLKVEVWFSTTTTTISNRSTKILLEVVLSRGKPPQFIILDILEWNDEIRKLFQTIQHSSTKIEEMLIWMNPQLKHVSDVVATFPHLTRKLKLELDGEDDDEGQRFCRKLTEEIIKFETSYLQTEELKVEVRYSTTLLLEVVLRRGKPSQFTKFAIYGWNDEIRILFQTIQHSSSKIEEMEIWMKPQLKHVSDVVATFPHFTRKLVLRLSGKKGNERQRICRKLTEEIINFDTSKLQTEELKVEVRYSKILILEVVLRRGEPVQFTKFDIYEWNDEILKLFQTIQHSSTKIEEMEIKMNPQLKYVSDVVATFPHFTRKLELKLFGDHVERRRKFCRKLTEEIINFDNSILQTEELKVEVRDDYSPILLLEVVLHRGDPPHFTKFPIFEWNDEIRKLFQTIQHSSTKIEEMEIWNPQLKQVSDVVATFPHLTRMLNLVFDGGDDDERLRRFCRKLTEEIRNFDTSKLQTQELKVEVRDRFSTILEVVLRPGEPPQFTKLNICGWNDDEIRKLFQTIQHSSTKIEEMKITMNPQQLEHVSDVVATFPLLTRKLKLELDGGDDERRRFCRKLTEEIINFDTSKLQTEELKVEVRDLFSTIPLLEVVLRRGELLPQFIK